MKKIQIFAMQNDTDKFAVIINDVYQLFNNIEDANKVYARHADIEESIFYAIQIMQPGEGNSKHSKLSAYDQTDLEAYEAKERAELKVRVEKSLERLDKQYEDAIAGLGDGKSIWDILNSKKIKKRRISEGKNESIYKRKR